MQKAAPSIQGLHLSVYFSYRPSYISLRVRVPSFVSPLVSRHLHLSSCLEMSSFTPRDEHTSERLSRCLSRRLKRGRNLVVITATSLSVALADADIILETVCVTWVRKCANSLALSEYLFCLVSENSDADYGPFFLKKKTRSSLKANTFGRILFSRCSDTSDDHNLSKVSHRICVFSRPMMQYISQVHFGLCRCLQQHNLATP